MNPTTAHKKIFTTEKSNANPQLFSQAVGAGNLLFFSGTTALDLKGNLAKGDMEAQTRQVFENIKAILESANSSLDDVLKIVVYLTERENVPKYREVRKRYLPDNLPASTLVIVKGLTNPDYLIEVDGIALIHPES